MHAAKALLHLGQRSGDGDGLGDIHLAKQFRSGAAGGGLQIPVDHRGARRSQVLGDLGADAIAGAGDDGYLASKVVLCAGRRAISG